VYRPEGEAAVAAEEAEAGSGEAEEREEDATTPSHRDIPAPPSSIFALSVSSTLLFYALKSCFDELCALAR